MKKLLIDYLDEKSQKVAKLREEIAELRHQIKEIYDRDIYKEIEDKTKKIAKIHAEVRQKLLENLEEFRMLKKYYPELLEAFLEDENIGKAIKKRLWILEVGPKKNAMRLFNDLRLKRQIIKRAIKELKAYKNTKKILKKYPMLVGLVSSEEWEEALEQLKELDNELKILGWELILSDPKLTEIAIAKLMHHYPKSEKKIIQILLLSQWQPPKKGPFKEILEKVHKKRVSEQIWLREMRKKLS